MSAYWKDIIREIWNTKGRFLSLLIIAALGSASIVGIQAASIDMRAVADQMYKERSLYDVQIKSTMGFDEDDIGAVIGAPGVEAVMPSYMFDVYAYFGSETRTVRAYSLPAGQSLNQIELIAGRLPENSSECAVEERFLDFNGYRIGDTVSLGLDDMADYNDVFEHSELTVTGVVNSPLYINIHDRGLTTLGNGRLDYYLYMHPSAFLFDVYTDLYVLMSRSQNMDQLTDEYGRAADVWVADIKFAGNERVRFWENELADARRELEEGYIDYYDGLAELEEEVADGWRELDDAARELFDAKIELEEGQQELDDEIASALAEVNRHERELNDGQEQINTQRAALSSGQSTLNAARAELEITLGELEASLAELEMLGPEGVSPELDALYAQVRQGIASVQDGFAEIETQQAQINSGRSRIASAQDEIDSGREEIARARRRIESERIEAQQEIDDGWDAYYEGLAEYEDGILTLQTQEADARIELADAWDELQDAEAELADAPDPEWFYFTRKDGVAFDSYYQDTLRLEQIGFVFPLVFFIVAVMVALTTMTRMVEEHRTQIGVYKALGFSTGRVITKYLLYAFVAGVLGGVLGVAGGSYVFPMIITDAYGYLYDMPQVSTPVPLFIGTLAIAASTGAVALVTLFTCIKAVSHEPSVLMRPKPPRSGKRVLIERVPLLWNRFSFIGKVTARNIFRYKTRFFMTLVGVAGCAALLVTAFGLRDSIGGVSTEQFGRIVGYDARVFFKDITDDAMREQLDDIISDTRSLYIREESVLASQSEKIDVSLIVPEDFDKLPDFINFFVPQTGEVLEPGKGGVVITEKLAKQTGTGIGEYMTISIDDIDYDVPVTGIAENYLLNYMYMPSEIYTELLGEDAVFNGAMIISDDLATLSYALLANENVRAFSASEDQMESIADSTDALGIVTVVLIVLACALALVVLFNLTNINITERIRELATIKVLGFYNAELALYIYRENLIVTAMGIALGTWAGLFLHGFILVTVEVDMLMFPRIINTSSYVWAAALSAVFAVLVNIIMNFRLSSIDMVASLKNVE